LIWLNIKCNDLIISKLDKKKSSFPIDLKIIENARIKVKSIISDFKKSNELQEFLNRYSQYYDKSFIISNGDLVVKKSFDLADIKDICFSKTDFAPMIINEKTKSYNKVACVYMIKDNNTNYYYIGSSINLFNRIKSHLINYRKINRGGNSIFYRHVKSSGGWGRFSFFILKETPSCLIQFMKDYPNYKLIKEEVNLLNIISIFIVRVYELLLIERYQPPLNQYRGVVFSFMNVNNNSSDKINTYYRVYNKDNILIMECTSLIILNLNLGLSKTTLRRYLNLDKSVYSKKLNLYVKIRKEDSSGKIISILRILFNERKTYPSVTGINLNELPYGLIAIDRDKKTILGKYNSIKEAALSLDNKKEIRYISRYINKEKLVRAGTFYCYFVRDPNKERMIKSSTDENGKSRWSPNRKGVILFDIIDKSIISFEQIKDLLIYLGDKNPGDTSKIKKYLITKNNLKYYKNRYKFLYLSDLALDPAFEMIQKFLGINVKINTKPILVYNKSNKSLILFENLLDLYKKLSLGDNFNIDNYLYRSKNDYKNYQFIYLVDFYCHNIYKDFLSVKIQLKKDD
jgi:GIY-YIG catalytic domain